MIELIVVGLFIAALWALGPLFQKIVLGRGVSSATIIVVSGLLTLTIGSIFAFYHRTEILQDFQKITLETVALIGFAGIICGLFANYLFLGLLSRYDAYLVSSLVSASPAFTLVFAFALLGEEISMLSALGFVLLTSGVFVIAYG